MAIETENLLEIARNTLATFFEKGLHGVEIFASQLLSRREIFGG